MSQSEIQKIVWSLNAQNPPASWQRFIQARNASAPVHPPIPDDLAFVVFLSWLRERGVTFADIDLAAEPTISLADLHPVVAKYVLIVRSEEFQRELKKFTDLVNMSYPPDQGTSPSACPQVDPTTISHRAKLPAPPSDPNYFKDPPISVPPARLAQWGAQMKWPLSELLQWGRSETENQASCNLTDVFMQSLLNQAIAYAAKDPPNRTNGETRDLFLKCRVPAMQAIMLFFGFRVYPLEPRVLMFARFVEYMNPFADPSDENIVMADEDWAIKAVELDRDLGGPKQYTGMPNGFIAGAWIRYRKKEGCGGGSDCPTSAEVHVRVNVAVSTNAPPATPPAQSSPPPINPPTKESVLAKIVEVAGQAAAAARSAVSTINSVGLIGTTLNADKSTADAAKATATAADGAADAALTGANQVLAAASSEVARLTGLLALSSPPPTAAQDKLVADGKERDAQTAKLNADKARKIAAAELKKAKDDFTAVESAFNDIVDIQRKIDGFAADASNSSALTAGLEFTSRSVGTLPDAEKYERAANARASVTRTAFYAVNAYASLVQAKMMYLNIQKLASAEEVQQVVQGILTPLALPAVVTKIKDEVTKAEAAAGLAEAEISKAATAAGANSNFPAATDVTTALQAVTKASDQQIIADKAARDATDFYMAVKSPPQQPPAPRQDLFQKFNFKLAGLTRYKVHTKQEALDEALDKGMLIPLKMNTVPDLLVRNFAAAFMLGGQDLSREPAQTVKARCIKFLERFVYNHHFLLQWLIIKGYAVDAQTNDADLYKAYYLHQACEQGGVGDPCNLVQILARAKNPALQASHAQRSSLLLQVPNSGVWMRVEPAGPPDAFRILQAIGSASQTPDWSQFSLSAVVNTPLPELLRLLERQRFEIKL